MSEIPNGTYRAKAVGNKGELIESAKGTPGICVELELTLPEGVLERLTWTGWLSNDAFARTVEALRTLGWKGEDLDRVDGLDQEVSAVVKAEEYQGSLYPRIAFINRPGSPLGASMTGEKAKSFAATMRDRIKAFDAAGGRAPKKGPGAPPQQPEPPPHNDFDVPF